MSRNFAQEPGRDAPPIIVPMPRRSFLTLSLVMLAGTAAATVAATARTGASLATDVAALTEAPDEVSNATTLVAGADVEPGWVTVRAEGSQEAGWLACVTADGAATSWPELPEAADVTLLLAEGDTLTLADGARALDEPTLADDLANLPTHAGLLVVGHDIEAGDWRLAPMDEGAFRDWDDDATHPTLGTRMLGRACDEVARRIGSYVTPWCGYVLATPAAGSRDPTATTDAASPLALELLSEDEPEVRLVGNLGRDAQDNYLSWLSTHGLTHVDTDSDPVIVTLTDGQLFCPVMMSVERYHAIDVDERREAIDDASDAADDEQTNRP